MKHKDILFPKDGKSYIDIPEDVYGTIWDYDNKQILFINGVQSFNTVAESSWDYSHALIVRKQLCLDNIVDCRIRCVYTFRNNSLDGSLDESLLNNNKYNSLDGDDVFTNFSLPRGGEGMSGHKSQLQILMKYNSEFYTVNLTYKGLSGIEGYYGDYIPRKKHISLEKMYSEITKHLKLNPKI